MLDEQILPPVDGRKQIRARADIDRQAYAREYAQAGRVRVASVLSEESAALVETYLLRSADWRQVLNSGDKIYELDRATRAGLTAEKARALDEAVYAGAGRGFQYRYETIRIPDDADARATIDDPVGAWASWLSEGEGRELVRAITADDGIAFADAQATAYAGGDFLTGHDDAVPGKNRRAAYVLGLTRSWRIEWGGLLLFHTGGGSVFGLEPAFNTLDLFRVPQAHSVSLVSPAARHRRLSVTGWLRA